MAVKNEDFDSQTETTGNTERHTSAYLKLTGLDDHRNIQPQQSELPPPVDCSEFNTEIHLLPERADYHISELLAYHDRNFIKQAYAAILKRSPTESEFASQTENLRSGRERKIEIIENLLRSSEGKRVNTRITGLKSAAHKRLVNLPVVGYFVRIISGVIRLPILLRNQERFQNFSLGQQQRLADYFQQMNIYFGATSSEATAIREISETLPMLFDAVVEVNGKIELIQSQIETINAKLEEHRQRTNAKLEEHRQRIDTTERRHQSITDEQQAAYARQREFLIQEQAVIVETQRMILIDLQSQLAELSARQHQVLAEFATHQRDRVDGDDKPVSN
ncbi:MAG TPA: DUF4214 domain-containing protein [Pyrinomonadaceae bacterium]|nr:DUF4214 domain-containing protein [Pyrinomonadaceae bacterium]